MKTYFVYILATALMLAGCAPATTAPETPLPQPPTAAPTAIPEPDTITFWISEGVDQEVYIPLTEKYNSSQSAVKVEVEVVPSGSQGTGFQDKIGTALAAGNPPDVAASNISILGQAGVFDTELIVDQTPYITDALRDDYGPILETYQSRGKLYGYPTAVRLGFAPFIGNKALLEAAGIDYRLIQQNGWTWAEFVEALSKLKQADVSGEVTVWPLIVEGSQWHLGMMYSNFARTNCIGANHSANPMYGNKFNYGGPKMVEAVQFVYDLIYEHELIPREAIGMNVDQMFQSYIAGTAALYMTEPGLVDPIKQHNEKIESGELQGTQVAIDSVLLPFPHNPPCPTAADTRPAGLMIFRQEASKGEAHIQNAVNFAQYLVSTESMTFRYKEAGLAPATKSAIDALPELANDEYAQGFYAILDLAATPNPPNHPNWFHLYWDIIYPLSQAVLADTMTPQAAVDEWTQTSTQDMETWVAQNPDQAALLAEVPPATEWPGSMFPCDRGILENYSTCVVK